MTSILTMLQRWLHSRRSAASTQHGGNAGSRFLGFPVGTASDNAAYWSIATTMRSDNMALSAVQDALGLGAAKVDTAYAGMENAVEVVKEIRAKLVAATEDGVDKAKIQEEIEQLKQQLDEHCNGRFLSGEELAPGGYHHACNEERSRVLRPAIPRASCP